MNHVILHHRTYPAPSSAAKPIVLLHGFLGSSTNWHSIARQLSEHHSVVVPDLRNHGQSPHCAQMDYAVMCNDLVTLLDANDYTDVILVGHSMGGKLAMEVALQYPERVAQLAVVDIAPVRYRHDFAEIFDGLRAVDLSQALSRVGAERQMGGFIREPGVRQFLLQNLVRSDSGFQWRINLDVLQAAIPAIQSAPPSLQGACYSGPVSVIYGEDSTYVQPAFHSVFNRHFPSFSYTRIPDAGHWVYAEQPELFMRALQSFLCQKTKRVRLDLNSQ